MNRSRTLSLERKPRWSQIATASTAHFEVTVCDLKEKKQSPIMSLIPNGEIGDREER